MWSVLFVFLSYLDRNFVKADFLSRALDVEKQGKEMFSMLNGTFCAKMSALGENFFYQVSDGTELVRSVVSPAEKLVDCSVTINQAQVKSFVHECGLGTRGRGAGWRLETRFARKDEAKLMCEEFKKRSWRSGAVRTDDPSDSALQDEPLKRSKRGFTYPGTLWCGLGNMADDYDQLGDFAETDSCCRTHDHCPHVIHAFSYHYGYANMKWHSISHCDCDEALKDCLRKVNDTSSRVVGQAFFNVIGVSCFDLTYEEQCAERHWYGPCKRYEKSPIAVVREAAPYDFGGIDVIDELTVGPPRNKDSKKSPEEPETTPPPTVSGLEEEPSLTNVVTAAEDFIKVLATVSTSQSSNADSDKGETQGSEKKKRKNGGKKKKPAKKQKGKEKARKRKQKPQASVRMDEGAAVSPSGDQTKDNFINESHKHKQLKKNGYRVDEGKYDRGREEEPPNKVMKGEPVMGNESGSVTSSVQEKPKAALIGHPLKAKNRRPRKERREKKESQDGNASDDLSAVLPVTTTTQVQPPNLKSNSRKQPVLGPVRRPAVLLTAKKTDDGEGREITSKVGSISQIVSIDRINSSALTLSVFRGQAVCGGRLAARAAPSARLSTLKRQRMEEKRLRSRRRKPVLPLSDENRPFRDSAEHALVRPTSVAPNSLADAAATGELTEKPETLSEWRRLTTVGPAVATQQRTRTGRQRRKPRKKAARADLRHAPVTFPTASLDVDVTEELDAHRPGKMYATTTGAPAMRLNQLSVNKTKAQFTRKKL